MLSRNESDIKMKGSHVAHEIYCTVISPHGNYLGIIWDFPHVHLMWFFSKHMERTNQQPQIIMVEVTASCFLRQVSSGVYARHHLFCFSP